MQRLRYALSVGTELQHEEENTTKKQEASMKIEKIPENILEDLRWKLSDEEIVESTPDHLFSEYCEWHGLWLWGYRLIDVLDSLRACKE